MFSNPGTRIKGAVICGRADRASSCQSGNRVAPKLLTAAFYKDTPTAGRAPGEGDLYRAIESDFRRIGPKQQTARPIDRIECARGCCGTVFPAACERWN